MSLIMKLDLYINADVKMCAGTSVRARLKLDLYINADVKMCAGRSVRALHNPVRVRNKLIKSSA